MSVRSCATRGTPINFPFLLLLSYFPTNSGILVAYLYTIFSSIGLKFFLKHVILYDLLFVLFSTCIYLFCDLTVAFWCFIEMIWAVLVELKSFTVFFTFTYTNITYYNALLWYYTYIKFHYITYLSLIQNFSFKFVCSVTTYQYGIGLVVTEY